jgi:5-(hydroxymethyl)furfural/furfural oxidase
LNLLSDPRDVTRMMACVRHLVRWVVTPGINANPDDLFPAAFTPRIKKLSLVSPSNAVLNRLLGAMLDVPAALRRPVLRTFMSNGRSLSDIATDDGRLEDFVRRNVFGVWHASGTCRMGRADDPLAVTDPSGKVIGTDNLYVADASVMPRLPTANTNIPTIMIAEKIAEGLRARH